MNKKDNLEKSLKLLAKSSFIVFVSLVLSKILVYLYRIIIARNYGPEIYGLFALSIMLIGWFRVFSGLGLKQGLLRFVSLFRGKKEEKKIAYVFRISLFILVFTSIIAGVLLYFLSETISLQIFSNPDLIIFLKIFSIVIPLTVLGEMFLSVIRAYEKIGWFSFISNILGNFIKLIFLILFIFLGLNSSSVSTSYLIGTFFVFILAYIICNITIPKTFDKDKKINNKKNKKAFKKMFSYAWPFIFQGVMIYVFYWIDSLAIGIFKSATHVGFYHAAVPIALLLTLPLDLFRQLFFPLVTKKYSEGNMEEVKQLSKQVVKWVFMLILPFFILFMMFPGAFINILFGEEYLVAENALRFLSIGVLFSAFFGISQDLISIKGKSKIILIDIVFAAIINIILNLIFVPLYGITGAGFATMLSLIFLNLLFFVQCYKYLSIIPIRRKMLRISMMAILATLLLLILKSFIKINLLSLILLGLFLIIVYFFLIFSTNCLDENDWYVLKIFLKKAELKRFFKNKKFNKVL